MGMLAPNYNDDIIVKSDDDDGTCLVVDKFGHHKYRRDNIEFYKVFVYGSLRKGFGNHILLKDCEYVGDAWALQYAMQHLTHFPSAFVDYFTQGARIFGEVYEITNEILQRLDHLEGHPDFYKRQEIQIPKFGWCLIYTQKIPQTQYQRVVSGKWEGPGSPCVLTDPPHWDKFRPRGANVPIVSLPPLKPLGKSPSEEAFKKSVRPEEATRPDYIEPDWVKEDAALRNNRLLEDYWE
jgi:gamma-glutamylaminecyclotransferase